MTDYDGHSLAKPEIIGYYSVDDEGNYLSDSSKMSYYNPPQLGPVRMDLNSGIKTAVKTPEDYDTSLNYLLKWIELNEPKLRASNTGKTGTEFVCSSGLLSIVMDTPYSAVKPQWQICASKWKGKIYLRRFGSYEGLSYYNETVAQKLTFWSYKFKQYVLSDHPARAPDASRPVIEPAEFRCVFKQRFGTNSVLLTAKMDGVLSKTALNDPLPLDKLKFVILKSKKVHEGAERSFQLSDYDLIRWWTQCYVTGTEDILCGFRDYNGRVQELTEYKLEKIVEMCKMSWNLQTGVDYCENFLNLVAKTVVQESETMVYRFEKLPKCGENSFSKNDISIRIHEHPTSKYVFVPPSFMAKMK